MSVYRGDVFDFDFPDAVILAADHSVDCVADFAMGLFFEAIAPCVGQFVGCVSVSDRTLAAGRLVTAIQNACRAGDGRRRRGGSSDLMAGSARYHVGCSDHWVWGR